MHCLPISHKEDARLTWDNIEIGRLDPLEIRSSYYPDILSVHL